MLSQRFKRRKLQARSTTQRLPLGDNHRNTATTIREKAGRRIYAVA